MIDVATNDRRERAMRRASTWPARVALALLVVASDACTCVVNPPNDPPGPGAAGAGGATGAGGAGGAATAGSARALEVGCRGDACRLPPPASLRPPQCPVGSSCDLGSGNGRGIYVAREGAYCMVDDARQGFALCPEYFVNSPNGVALVMRDPRNPLSVREARVTAALVESGGAERPVQLLGVRAQKAELFARFDDGGGAREVNGAALEALRLRVVHEAKDLFVDFTLKIEAPSQTLGAVRRYAVKYKPTGAAGAFRRHCGLANDTLSASFLGGKRVDGLTAQVDDDPAATTMSCEKGAIDSCLDWGYAPWNPRAGGAAQGSYLFATCLQAKRAAYFVRSGDTNSYTADGTLVYRRDPFGIRAEPTNTPDDSWVDGLEAIWSPQGAECLNPDRRRRPEIPIPAHNVPRCDPARWTLAGKLAIVPANRAPATP